MPTWAWFVIGYILFLPIFVWLWHRYWTRMHPLIPEDQDNEDQRS